MARDRLYIDDTQDAIVKEWTKDNRYYNFKDSGNRGVFLLSILKGYDHYDPLLKINRYEGGYIRVESLKDDDIRLFYTLFLSKGGEVQDLLDTDKVFDFVEKCAYKGIRVIQQEIDSDRNDGLFELRTVKELNRSFEASKGNRK